MFPCESITTGHILVISCEGKWKSRNLSEFTQVLQAFHELRIDRTLCLWAFGKRRLIRATPKAISMGIGFKSSGEAFGPVRWGGCSTW